MKNSGLTDKVQEIIPKADNAFKVKSEERRITRVINQLISGNSCLNYMPGKIDNTKSGLCDNCKVKETTNHYMYDCESDDEERRILERDIEAILAAYGLQHISDINLKVMRKQNEQQCFELKGALAGFITRSGRFTNLKSKYLRSDIRFPTMCRFDMNRLRRACAASC